MKAKKFLSEAGNVQECLFLLEYRDDVEKHEWGKRNYMYVFNDGSALIHADYYLFTYPGKIKWNGTTWEDVGEPDIKAQMKFADKLKGAI